MKFARLLRTTAEDLPELQCLFHIYKHMKKQLKKLPARAEPKPPPPQGDGPSAAHEPPPQPPSPRAAAADAAAEAARAAVEAAEEARFTAVLTEHLQRLNDRFLEREETCVIQLERLEVEVGQCSSVAKAAKTAAEGARAAATATATATGGRGGAAATAASGDAAGVGPAGAGSVGAAGAGADADASRAVAAAAAAAAAAAQGTLNAVTEQRAQLYKRFVNFHGQCAAAVASRTAACPESPSCSTIPAASSSAPNGGGGGGPPPLGRRFLGELGRAVAELRAGDKRLDDPATVSRLKRVLETYTDVTRYPRPRRTDATVIVAATDDAYVSVESVRQMHSYYAGSELRLVSGGHVSAFLMHQTAFRGAIRDSLARVAAPPPPQQPQ
ncbi:hypothetical protein TSOC_010885 [Tetrabaena socialis]|uniref:SPX domain-containing protein n=1 Tax=Tetrabaena socialis TaxID=47790 RepID=A0A2J7ZS47_9CHLO|nr:hypothetical protein TSOC_010885 [Tetrabaena socialis]|eukprot:PNH03096.1 hypothetical protein TSOC_010885 [Tetrabaena socialis]